MIVCQDFIDFLGFNFVVLVFNTNCHILQTDKISDFRESRQTKGGNHKGLPLHDTTVCRGHTPRKPSAKKTKKTEKLTVLCSL
jgi:hypothetical protein